MNVVDSSGWLEFFAGSAHASRFEQAILATAELLVPVVCLYEVFKTVCRQRSETDALFAISAMQHGTVIDIDTRASLRAAQLSLEYRIPMADSLILAVAQLHDATLWTQDSDFDGLPGVRYFPA